jgi:hypothetical protein
MAVGEGLGAGFVYGLYMYCSWRTIQQNDEGCDIINQFDLYTV